jgi:hypothetical protein
MNGHEPLFQMTPVGGEPHTWPHNVGTFSMSQTPASHHITNTNGTYDHLPVCALSVVRTGEKTSKAGIRVINNHSNNHEGNKAKITTLPLRLPARGISRARSFLYIIQLIACKNLKRKVL